MIIRLILLIAVTLGLYFSIRGFLREWPHIKAAAGNDARKVSQGSVSFINMAIAYLRNRPFEAFILFLIIAILCYG